MTRTTRRHLLTNALHLGAALPLGMGMGLSRAAAAAPPRVLVLVELNGGNDGLNSVVPYADPAYVAARPRLAVARDSVLPLDERLGLNPALAPLMPSWQAGDLAVALGVGYPRPNRSHFRSIEIWDSASDADETLQHGWLHRVLTEVAASGADMPDRFAAQGIVLGGAEGPLAGPALGALALRDPRQLAQAAGAGRSGGDSSDPNPALTHLLDVRGRLQGAATDIARRLEAADPPATAFPKTALGRQLKLAGRLIAAGVPASVLKVQHSGYDTHAGQNGRHRALLADLADSLAAFRLALIEAGAWQRTLVMTYAEFGRRVAENASGGTDHGTAAPHLLLGGRVAGGLVGAQPALDDLEGGDLRHRLDFRSLYATAAQSWLGLPATPDSLGRHRPLALLA